MAEFSIEVPEGFGQSPPEPIRRRRFVARIAKNFKGKFLLLDERPAEGRDFRRNGKKPRSLRFDFRKNFVESLQLRVAIGSPVAPEEGQDHGTSLQKIVQGEFAAAAVLQYEGRRRGAFARHVIEDA
jgi:hypothetical protein